MGAQGIQAFMVDIGIGLQIKTIGQCHRKSCFCLGKSIDLFYSDIIQTAGRSVSAR